MATATILRLDIANVTGIQAVQIKPNGKPVVLSGANGAGKSSILDAIQALKGKRFHVSDFIQHGKDKGTIEVETDYWIARLTVTPKGEKLEVYGPEGEKYAAPQGILNKWLGDVTFDPLAFKSLPMEEQTKVLKQITGLDLSDEEAQYKKHYDERTIVGREVKSLQARVEALPTPVEGLPDELVSAQNLQEQINGCVIKQKAYEDAIRTKQTLQASIERTIQEIKELERSLANQNDKLKNILVPIDDFTEPEAKAIQAMSELDETNKQIREKWDFRELNQQWKEKLQEQEDLTEQINEIIANKGKKIAEVQFPIKGLSIDDGVVLYEGTRTDQLSDGEAIRVSCAIAMALNPLLRVILIRNGSLLDQAGKEYIFKLAEEKGYQVWVENVAEQVDGKYPAGFYLEHGLVKAVDGVEVEEPQVQAGPMKPAF